MLLKTSAFKNQLIIFSSLEFFCNFYCQSQLKLILLRWRRLLDSSSHWWVMQCLVIRKINLTVGCGQDFVVISLNLRSHIFHANEVLKFPANCEGTFLLSLKSTHTHGLRMKINIWDVAKSGGFWPYQKFFVECFKATK